MARSQHVTRFAALGAALLLAACTRSEPAAIDMTQGFDASPSRAAGASATAGSVAVARPGYALAGVAFSGLIEFDEQDGRPVILYRHAVDGAPPLVAELAPERAWLSDGVRRFEGVSDQGLPVDVELVSGVCRVAGRDHARFARVNAGRLNYEGCAREIGPSVRWSEALPRYAGAIDACLDASRTSAMATLRTAGEAYVIHARSEGAGPVIRFRFGETGRWDCVTGPERPQWRVVSAGAPVLPGEGDPVFAPGPPPAAGDGCYLWEHVRGVDGAMIGALGEDVCGSGAFRAPVSLTGAR